MQSSTTPLTFLLGENCGGDALSSLGDAVTLARLCQKAVRATWFLRQRETDHLMPQRVRHHDGNDSTG